jgi:hypothetical protein
MKKLLFIFAIAIIFIACKKDDNSTLSGTYTGKLIISSVWKSGSYNSEFTFKGDHFQIKDGSNGDFRIVGTDCVFIDKTEKSKRLADGSLFTGVYKLEFSGDSIILTEKPNINSSMDYHFQYRLKRNN